MSLLDDSDDLRQRREEAAQLRVWQVRVGELVREKAPIFLSELLGLVEQQIKDFNMKLGFRPPTSGLLITKVSDMHFVLEKNDTPYMRREVILLNGGAGPVEVKKTLVRHRIHEATVERWHFSASKEDGEVYLDNRTPFACMNELLSGIAELFE
jgi:hypothetical protein